MILLLKTYRQIFNGEKLYYKLLKANKILKSEQDESFKEWQNPFIIVFPSQNRGVSYTALLYLDSFFKYLEYLRDLTVSVQVAWPPVINRFIIVSAEQNVVDSVSYFSKRILKTELWQRHEIEQFMSYSAVHKPKNIIFASLDRPNGRYSGSLIGKKGLDLKTLVCMGIYGMSHLFFRSLQEPEKPFYNGENRELKDFINGGLDIFNS